MRRVLQSRTETAGAGGSKTEQHASSYSYDDIYQLTQVVLDGNVSESYTYDAVGNRLSALGSSPWTYNNSNELTSTPGASFSYDNNGNTTSKTDASGTTNYTWDYENRLTSITLPGSGGTYSFTYDPFGRRVRIVSPTGTVIYSYDGDNVNDVLDATGAWQSRITHGLGIDEPLEIRQQSVPLYYHSDGLGSIAAVTNAARAGSAELCLLRLWGLK